MARDFEAMADASILQAVRHAAAHPGAVEEPNASEAVPLAPAADEQPQSRPADVPPPPSDDANDRPSAAVVPAVPTNTV